MPDLVEAVPDCLLFDTDAKLTRPGMAKLWAAGFRGALRYVGFEDQPGPEDLDAEELDGLLATGFGVMVVQHCRRGLWHATGPLGTIDGRNGLRHALAAGIAQGTSFWDDLESIASTNLETAAYANAKRNEIALQLRAGEYVGDDVPLDSAQLFGMLAADRYWRSASQVPDVEHRGYCMVQMETVSVAGTKVDVNYHTADKLGGRAMWMRRAA